MGVATGGAFGLKDTGGPPWRSCSLAGKIPGF